MNNTGLKKWASKHPFSATLCVLYPVVSYASHFFPSNLTGYPKLFLNLFASENQDVIALNILFILLFSGVETTVGSLYFTLWMLWGFFNLLIGRFYIGSSSSGPNCSIFCTFLTFIFVHRPTLYFKIKTFCFTDSFFYVIGIAQLILIDPHNMIVDFIICCFSNLFLNLLRTLGRNIIRPVTEIN